VPSGSGVFAFEVAADAWGLERRSVMLACASAFVFSRSAANCDGEKDHSRNCDDCLYLASSVAMAGSVETAVVGDARLELDSTRREAHGRMRYSFWWKLQLRGILPMRALGGFLRLSVVEDLNSGNPNNSGAEVGELC